MKIQQYIKSLERGAGYDKALQIAERSMNATNPKEYSSLPEGVFFPKDRKASGYQEKELRDLHNWWTTVYHTMKKARKKHA